DAEAYAEQGSGREIRVHGGAVESLTEATERGIGVRTWIDGRCGYAYGTDLGAEALEQLALAATQAAQIADPDEFAAAPRPAGKPAEIAGLVDPAFDEPTTPQRIDLALEVEAAALAHDERVRIVEQVVYRDAASQVAIHSSSGIAGSYAATSCYAYAQALAGEPEEQQSGLGFDVGRSPQSLDPAAIGREAADRAVDQLGAVKPESRSCPVILDPTVAASFVSYIGGALGADAVQRGRSPLAGRLEDEVASAAFELIDDGLDPAGFGSSPFDDEGTARRRTSLISAGRLRAYLHDSYTARRGDAGVTGNASRSGYRSPPSVAPSNLIVGSGDAGLEGLLAQAEGGVYVTDVAGLHSGVNPISGVFSVGATGRRVAGGELGEPLREFTIASDLVGMLTRIAATGSEARWVPFGASVRTPALLVSEMTVSGS
ncbi:MAG: PmbA protein, partial [Solirubrobacterales bacterium]|nr:PmbA protein [Solirubrobacterales bacterium]